MSTPDTTVRLPIPGGVQLAVNLVQAGQQVVCVMGGQKGGTYNAEMAERWLAHWCYAFLPIISNYAQVTGAVLRDVSGPDTFVYEVGAPTSNAGTNGAGGTVPAASTLIKWTTTRGGRSGKGRTFLPGLAVANVSADGRTYSGAHGTAVQAAIARYIDNPRTLAVEVNPGILSFRRGVVSPIIGGSLASVVGLQRRRMR